MTRWLLAVFIGLLVLAALFVAYIAGENLDRERVVDLEHRVKHLETEVSLLKE